jgi:hypothetical protein
MAKKMFVTGATGFIHPAFHHDFSKFKQNCDAGREAVEALGPGLFLRHAGFDGFPAQAWQAITDELPAEVHWKARRGHARALLRIACSHGTLPRRAWSSALRSERRRMLTP